MIRSPRCNAPAVTCTPLSGSSSSRAGKMIHSTRQAINHVVGERMTRLTVLKTTGVVRFGRAFGIDIAPTAAAKITRSASTGTGVASDTTWQRPRDRHRITGVTRAAATQHPA
jgi:hypothetical protein